jgi:trehalose synthase-fused probable maltokinase
VNAAAFEARMMRSLPERRWFRGKGRIIRRVRLVDRAPLGKRFELALALVDYASGGSELYFSPFGPQPADDALDSPDFCLELAKKMRAGGETRGRRGKFVFLPPSRSPVSAREAAAAFRARPRPLQAEQSNTSAAFGRSLVLKAMRKLDEGANPGVEIPLFLTEKTAFRSLPSVAGWARYQSGAEAFAVAILQTFVRNQGDGWRFALDNLDRYFVAAARGAGREAKREADAFAAEARVLGETTRGLHEALGSQAPGEPFGTEPFTAADAREWKARLGSFADELAKELARERRDGFVRRASSDRRLTGLATLVRNGSKIRTHGDYHLGQVLKTPKGFSLIDFEGEPLRPLSERRRKQSPLRDAAGMLRSFDYAARMTLRHYGRAGRTLAPKADAWVRRARKAFLEGYLGKRPPACAGRLTRAEAERAIEAFELEKAVYEAAYELRNRPGWLAIPLEGLARMLGAPAPGGPL